MNKILFLLSIGSIIASCKKQSDEIKLSSTINVVNAAVDLPGIKVNTNRSTAFFSTIPQIAFGTGQLNYVPRTTTLINLVRSADSTSIINGNINFKSSLYTLYVIGQSPNLDTMLLEESNFPFIRQDVIQPSSDSIVNVRFANLSPNSVPVKIKIANATTNEVESLSFKQVSSWKAYPAKLATTAYSFQVRDALTDALLTTFTFNATGTNRFKNVMLILRGLQGTTSGTNALGVSPINYF